MNNDRWRGLRDSAVKSVNTRNYVDRSLGDRLKTSGAGGAELVFNREVLESDGYWIPGVEVFPRTVFQQKGRGHFAELARTDSGVLRRIGLTPCQWSSASMQAGGLKGFHVHPPFVPDGREPEDWFRELFEIFPLDYGLRRYSEEQWDVMFFLVGICEMILVDERRGFPRRLMRFSISGDSCPGPDHVAVVIPPGVSHALRDIGGRELVMVYGTSTSFCPDWEGRIVSSVECSVLPNDWNQYLSISEIDS